MKLNQIVVHFKLHSDISRLMFLFPMTEKLYASSKAILNHKPSLIAISINSNGGINNHQFLSFLHLHQKGSLIQARTIISILKDLSFRTKAPIYCFGEEVIGGAASAILTSANRCFASKHSIIGQFGFSSQFFDRSEINKKYGVETNMYTDTAKGSQIDGNIPFTDVDRSWMKQVLKQRQDELRKEVQKYRGDKFSAKGLTPQDVESKIFNQQSIFGAEAVENGLIDAVDTLDSVVYREFPKATVKLLEGKNYNQSNGGISVNFNLVNFLSPLALLNQDMK